DLFRVLAGLDLDRSITSLDRKRLVVFDGSVHVILAVDDDLLFALGVIAGYLVVAAAGTFVSSGHQAAGLLSFGEFFGRHVFRVVYAADDDRVVGIALQEIDDHFMADARDVDLPPAFACPGSGDPDPTRAVDVVLAFTVPMKLHFHPTILVGEDLFLTGRADDDSRLRSLDERLRRGTRGAIRLGKRDAGKRVLVLEYGVV